MLVLYLNIAAGAAAATIYGIWGLKWARRRVHLLAALNLVAMLASLGFVAGYAAVMLDALAHAETVRVGFRHLGPIILLAPAVARFIELRRDELQEAKATTFRRELRGEDG